MIIISDVTYRPRCPQLLRLAVPELEGSLPSTVHVTFVVATAEDLT
jgi:hypothetical protein